MDKRTVAERIAERAKLQPDAIAISAIDADVTYGDLIRHRDDVSQLLLSQGLKPEEPVAVLMQRDSALLPVLLGIWGAGGAYVPIDPGEPARRVRQILEKSNCRRIIGHDALWSPVCATVQDTFSDLQFTEGNTIRRQSAATFPAVIPKPGDLAYLLFTSGSTGEPKAVEVEHGSVANVLSQAQSLLSVSADDCYLAVSTLSFDISVVELFLPLMIGGKLVLRDKKLLLDPPALASLVREAGVSIVQTGPSVWSVLINEVPDFPTVRVAISTGEAISPEVALRLSKIAEESWNFYGPTEATIWATGFRLSHKGQVEDSWSGISAPIGCIVDGLTARICDAQGREVEPGERGELWIGGAGVARGYCGQVELTQERFVWLGETRFYKTGDLVSQDEKGVISYFGRIDDQMKIRGIRIEPREVEEAIRLVPKVKDTATTWFTTPSNTKAIVAAVVLQSDEECTAAQLHQALEDKLPGPLIPAKFIFVPWLPIDKNGKVDRVAIRSAVTGSAATEVTLPATQTEREFTATQKKVADVWQRILGVSEIDIDAHFFALGGDSLAAVTMTIELEAAMGVNLPQQLVLELPNLRDFAAKLDDIAERRVGEEKLNFIFPIVEVDGSTPVFFCGADLTVAAHWNVPCSLYTVAYWAKDGKLIEMTSIEAMASLFVEGIRDRQASGPYRIAGFSFGAIVALEIAQQLKRDGDEVEFLFLLDPHKPTNYEVVPGADFSELPAENNRWVRRYYWRLRHYLYKCNPFRQQDGVGEWIAKLVSPVENIPAVQWFLYQVFHSFTKNPNPVAEAYFARNRWPAFWFSARKKLSMYKPKSYTGKSFVMFTQEQGGQRVWSSLLGEQLELRFVQAGHFDIFKPPLAHDWMDWLSKEVEDSPR